MFLKIGVMLDFLEQPESDAVMDDIEAMLGVNREQMGFIPGEHGGRCCW
jgi:DNA topoisomerase VI subunit A